MVNIISGWNLRPVYSGRESERTLTVDAQQSRNRHHRCSKKGLRFVLKRSPNGDIAYAGSP
jgi:hypothetical protein